MFGSIPFLPGTHSMRPEPLSRYLPPVPDGVISTWLRRNVPQGSWILDPFGTAPQIALEAAHEGYRVLVAANNPINRFLLEMLANPPNSEELKAALAELSASYVGNERTEPHVLSLYNTYCSRCGQLVSAEAFYWEHGNPSPYMRRYSCPNCGDSGEHPCTPYDIDLSNKFTGSGLHRARALERVVAASDQDRIHVEQALSVYIPRALYALITIINKIEGLNISTSGQKHLKALLLYAFDQANAMWKVPSEKERRHQLTIPRHFRENNIWFALEEGINVWSKNDNASSSVAIPVTTWPEIPSSSGGICIYEGRFITLADSLKSININSVCTAIPRPNQAFWTLSALWAGWLWGREAVGSFKSVLRRQRYDWAWHTTALASVFKQLAHSLEPTTAVLGLITEAEPGFVSAAFVAAGVAGFRLESMAARPEEGHAQIIWKNEHSPELTHITPFLSQIAMGSAKSYLETRAEPASYLNTIASAFMGISNSWNSQKEDYSREKKFLPETPPGTISTNEQIEPAPSLIYTSTYNSAREALSFRSGFLRYNLQEISSVETTSNPQLVQSSLFDLEWSNKTVEDETGTPEVSSVDNEPVSGKERPTRSSDITESTFLWLREIDDVNHIPISDSYEQSLVNYLFNHPGCTLYDVDMAMCELYPGLFTPDFEFIRICMESYAAPDPHDPNRWYVRPEDNMIERRLDLEHARRFIHLIGERLGFICEDRINNSSKAYITWLDKNIDLEYWFYPMVSAAIGETVLYDDQPPMRGYIVLPGSRSNLLIYKLRRDPRISKAFNLSQGYWRFLKFRHLRSLAESPILNSENLDQLLGLDPITYSTPQILLL